MANLSAKSVYNLNNYLIKTSSDIESSSEEFSKIVKHDTASYLLYAEPPLMINKENREINVEAIAWLRIVSS